MPKTIPLTQGYKTTVDDNDYEILQRLTSEGKAPKKWQACVHKTHKNRKIRKTFKYYARGFYRVGKDKQKGVYLHALRIHQCSGSSLQYMEN